jgi:hypothetical protein
MSPRSRTPAFETYGQSSRAGKSLEIHQRELGRIHVVLIRQVAGLKVEDP